MKTTIPLTTLYQHHQEATTPTAMLRHEHEVILRALALLERLGRRLEVGESVDETVLAWLCDFFSTFADRCHHGKEEQHLFPALERQGVPREGGPLGVMLYEHEQGRAFLRAMREGNDQAIAEAISAYVELLRAHIDKENNVLFPLAEQVLPHEEQHGLVRSFDAVEEAVAGPGVHERILAEVERLEASVSGDRRAG